MHIDAIYRQRVLRTVKWCVLAVSLFAGFLLAGGGCQKDKSQIAAKPLVSKITVAIHPPGSILISTPEADFDILPSGYLQSYQKRGDQHLTLDDPGEGAENLEAVVIDGKEVRDFVLDLEHARITDSSGRLGSTGQRIELSGKSKTHPEIEKTIVIEVYDDFPALALSMAAYKNVGFHATNLDQVIAQAHRFNASLVDHAAAPYKMWSFHGASEKWGKDEITPVTEKFSRENPMEQVMPGGPGAGGGIPVVAFWTKTVGEAIGHLEKLPQVLSLPVRVQPDNRVNASLLLKPSVLLQSGETYSAPISFVAVFQGDFYAPLRLYSRALQAQGWKLPIPTHADYAANWCGWGYQLKFTPAQMLGTIPKLKELGLKWATLDAGWFKSRGDWQPRPSIGVEGIKKMTEGFHHEGIQLTLWWIPIVVEDGVGKDVLNGQPYQVADVVKEHPDWLMLDKDGNHARMTAGLAGLCPAVPEVQQYYRQLTERFIRDWGFDGHKLDFSFAVPPCYNPKHHHKSPDESTLAMGQVYKIIFDTTRALKPESVTQSCSCGTTPNIAWLSFIDQAVTADPVGPIQVRRRIKMYKALLGPEAAVYGDHVELTKVTGANTGNEKDSGRDFASTIGVGGVVGTKFTWPARASKFHDVQLTQEKEKYWKKWIGLYNQKMLSDGAFRDLYVYGYDSPEAYAIEKEGKMFYAFYAPGSWQGALELRGLGSGTFRVLDYENGRDLGTVDGQNAKLATRFSEHLLLEVFRK
jgi:alpha-galactosidase